MSRLTLDFDIAGKIKELTLASKYRGRVFLKTEYKDTLTGSHKDRESLHITEHCLSRNIIRLGCASTGNFGISLAAHCLKAGLQCDVWVSRDISPKKLAQLKSYCPRIHFVDDSRQSSIYDVSNWAIKDADIFNANPGVCDLKVIANEEIGRSITKSGMTFDYVVCPTNNGTLLKGVWRGLGKKRQQTTKMIGACSRKSQLATSISGYFALDDPESVFKSSGGYAMFLTDSEIKKANALLHRRGYQCEVSSSASFAAAKRILLNQHKKPPTILCLITGGVP